MTDEHLAVIDKPAGMVCHLGAGIRSGTLVNALLHHLGPLDAGDPARPTGAMPGPRYRPGCRAGP